jgi:hypothetical protein
MVSNQHLFTPNKDKTKLKFCTANIISLVNEIIENKSNIYTNRITADKKNPDKVSALEIIPDNEMMPSFDLIDLSSLKISLVSKTENNIISDKKNEKFDIIFCNTPFYLDENATRCLPACFDRLTDTGLCFAFMKSIEQIRRLELNNCSSNYKFHPSCIINLPENSPWSIFSKILVIFSKGSEFQQTCFANLLVSEFNNNVKMIAEKHKGHYLGKGNFDKHLSEHKQDITSLIETIKKINSQGETLEAGVNFILSIFPGFEIWEFLETSNNETIDYQSYEKFYLEDICIPTKDNSKQSADNIYFPKKHWGAKLTNLDHNYIKQSINEDDSDSYFKLTLNKDLIIPEYLLIYLASFWGQKFILQIINSKNGKLGSQLPYELSEINKLVISVPSISTQNHFINTINKIENASETFRDIRHKLLMNPISYEAASNDIGTVLEAISNVSPLLLEESISLEFKASLRMPFPNLPDIEQSNEGNKYYKLPNSKQIFTSQRQVFNYMQNIVLKAVASLLNTKGGSLYIGVLEKDNIKKVVGIDREGLGSHDEYERHINQLLNNTFGPTLITDYVKTEIIMLEGKYVCHLKCKPYLNGVWFEDKLFVRTGPMVSELVGKEISDFHHNRSNLK